MEDDVALGNQTIHDHLVEDGVDGEAQMRATLKVLEVVDRASGKVVEYLDVPAQVKEFAAEMTADEAGAAGNECASCQENFPIGCAGQRKSAGVRRYT